MNNLSTGQTLRTMTILEGDFKVVNNVSSKARIRWRTLKVHQCRFDNFPICWCSYKNTILKTSYS